MIILAFDTSVTGCAVCVYKDGQTWADRIETDRGQAELLVPLIDKTMQQADVAYKDIERIAVTVGPGSFTGVRIGLSTAKALALTLDKPLIGFSTLDVVGEGAEEKKLILVDTKRGDYYGQISGESDQARIWSLEAVQSCSLPIIQDQVPDVTVMAAMAARIETISSYHADDAPKPIYLRGAEVSQSKRIVPNIIKKLTEDAK